MYYSPLEQFEPIPYIFPFKLGFFYIFGTNVTYILLLLIGIFFFINGSFWLILNSSIVDQHTYNSTFKIDKYSKVINFLKTISLPLDFIVYFYKNRIFPLFISTINLLFTLVSSNHSILLMNYKINLFKSLTNYFNRIFIRYFLSC
jgi:hypothetical protein